MVIALLLSLLMAQATTPAKPPAPQPQPTTQKPAPAQPRTTTARPPVSTAVAGMAITATDGKGTPFGDVTVELSGLASDRKTTNAAGQTNFPGLRAGTYRLRFSGDAITTFEREVTLKAGAIEQLAITLTAAPPPPKPVVVAPPPPAAPPRPVAGPVGGPQVGSLKNLADRERNAKERREILLSCSGNTRNMLLVLTGEQTQRIYDTAESTYYVISGQGGAIAGGVQSLISEGSFLTVPRGTPFTIARQGNRPLAMLWTLSGEPCEMAK